MTPDPKTLLFLLLTLIGVAPFLLQYRAATEAQAEAVTIAGETWLPPWIARRDGRPVLDRDHDVERALRVRGRTLPATGAAPDGCVHGIGVAGSVVLLDWSPWGRLAEASGRGVLVLSPDAAAALAETCRSAPLAGDPE